MWGCGGEEGGGRGEGGREGREGEGGGEGGERGGGGREGGGGGGREGRRGLQWMHYYLCLSCVRVKMNFSDPQRGEVGLFSKITVYCTLLL